jgi:hypothetical protein
MQYLYRSSSKASVQASDESDSFIGGAMAIYPKLPQIVLNATPGALEKLAVPYLLDVWQQEYASKNRAPDIVETTQDGSSFLFDISRQRLIAAWAISRGPNHAARDSSRMRGHPLAHGPEYHRGHAIPHSAGGPLDINLVPQRGSVNIGPFRVLEKEAVANPGSLYFTYWIYTDQSQMPSFVEQGLLRGGFTPRIVVHRN